MIKHFIPGTKTNNQPAQNGPNRSPIAVGGVAVAAGLMAFSMHGCSEQFKSMTNFVDKLTGVTGHDVTQVSLNTGINKISLPLDVTLVEAEGYGEATVNVRRSIPLFSSLTDRTKTARRFGNVQISSKANDIKLSAIQAPSPVSGKSQWQLKAEVPVEKLSTHIRDMRYATQNGLTSDNDTLSFARDAGNDKRAKVVESVADQSFRTKCGEAIEQNLPAAVEKFGHAVTSMAAELYDSTNSQSNETNVFKLLAKRPVIVEFTEPVRMADNTVKRRKITVKQIEMPSTIPSPAAIAKELGTNSDEKVTITPGSEDCKFSETAMKQQLKIAGAGTTPAY